ncbi:NAD(P)/FAD-dependent oxidoreductase [Streptomyces albireticuli]|uniref:Oxidoreductase n=1 Tax=Streptomyces albireticuli TaxID=1940 RepID=A0A2A2D5R9_9ACTN|nr:NAD(P)/FAD-dependent oxidoreductase [Streptomyces albireticuli]MCD9142058.1 FAD-dependent oxidoreductase [Streptomyces albireticuli]MCD9162688.1 FAD-dependent oxidoreductase [Streptomyces albireticuli]MCD9190232.1 FAD-dependent oxidoreductase [Streptomyces albireticuli]PAU46729.1 oxidoreductase [Streptomyces albireticuli]
MLSSARETAHDADVVIVGAGLAGLSAAHRLTAAGVTVTVLEAAPYVGGRMTTDRIDGFRLDRTAQLLNTAFPELLGTPGLGGLTLRPFTPGVLVHADGRNQRTGEPRGGKRAFTTARAFATAARASRSGGLDQARLGAALARLAALPAHRVLARPDRATADTLTGRGLPARTVEGFLRPLLASLLCDPDLTTSSRCADLVLRGYARGRLCLPEGGADTVPELLAALLPPGTVRTGVHAKTACTTSVGTAGHGEFRCRSVVVATGARAATELIPGLRLPDFHPVTVLHHTADEPPLRDASLIIAAGRRGPVAHTMVASEVDPTRAPDGRALITSTVLGTAAGMPTAELDRAARAQLARVYATSTSDWRLLSAHHDPDAVPAMPAPHDVRRPVRLLSGLYVCGDHRDTSTVQGALFSGRRAALAVLRDLGIRSPHPTESEELQAA